MQCRIARLSTSPMITRSMSLPSSPSPARCRSKEADQQWLRLPRVDLSPNTRGQLAIEGSEGLDRSSRKMLSV